MQGSVRLKPFIRTSGNFEPVTNSFRSNKFETVTNSVRISSVPRLASAKSEIIPLKDLADAVHQEIERLGLGSGDMWALGISIVIGGQYFAWNQGLHAGFGSLLLATVMVASGYICLVLCIAELSSALPFAGGSYGIARVTLGFFPGYLVAYMDCGESIVYVAVATYMLGEMITSVTGASTTLEPIYWVVFLVTSLAIHASGGIAFWWINRAVAVASLAIVIIYILGSVQYIDFNEYALKQTASDSEADRWFSGGAEEFMRILPLPCWFFVGVESINLACKDMIAPKKAVPRGYISCVGTLFLTCFAVLFTCCAQYPGVEVLKDSLNPFNYGFSRLFGISHRQATALSLPATYATASGFMFCYGRQLRAMGQSGLVTHFLGSTVTGWSTPVHALVGGSIIALAACFVMHNSETVRKQVFNICMLCALASYGTQFASFAVLRAKYAASIKREFVSPLGLAGAAWGSFVFAVVFISICGFQDNAIAIAAYAVFLAVVTIYYVLVAGARQFFSDEEKEVMFKAYVLKNNNARTTRMRKGRTLSARIIKAEGSGKAFTSTLGVLRSWAHLPGASHKVHPSGSAETSATRITGAGRNNNSRQSSAGRMLDSRGTTGGASRDSDHSDVESFTTLECDGPGGAYVCSEEPPRVEQNRKQADRSNLYQQQLPLPQHAVGPKSELGVITETLTEYWPELQQAEQAEQAEQGQKLGGRVGVGGGVGAGAQGGTSDVYKFHPLYDLYKHV